MAEKTEKKEFKIIDLPGVGAATAEKLEEAGFNTLMAIAVASPADMVEIAGVTEATARKIINTARNKLDMGFKTGLEALEEREKVDKITTNSKALDNLFGGGIETGAITECYGIFGSGKSSIAHQLAVNVQLPKDKGGAEGIAVWLDTESSLPYDEKILIEKDNTIQLVNMGEIVENALNNTDNIKRYGKTVSTADNYENVKAISYVPEDYKIKTFPITGFIKHPKQRIYEVTLTSGRKVRVTKHHNFFTLDKNCELNKIATENLKIGTKISVAGSIPVKMGINVIDNLKLFSDRKDLFVCGGEEFKIILKNFSKRLRQISKKFNKTYSSADNWIHRGRIPIWVYNELNLNVETNLKNKLRIGGWIRKSTIPLVLPITKDLMRFLGLYVAEGSCLKNKSVVITCTQEYVEDYVRYFASKLNLNVIRQKSDLKINSRPFALFIEKLNLGYTAETKKVPEFILNLEKEYIEAFLEGYVVGDGSEDVLTGTTTCETKSVELARGLLYSTCALNIPANHNINIRTYKSNEVVHIIPQKEGKKYDMQSISWQTELIRDSRLEELPNNELQFSKILLNAIRDNYGSIKEFSKLIDMNYCYFTNILHNGSNAIRKSNLKKILEHLPETKEIKKIKKIVDSDIWFDSVESIKELQEEVTYDVEVMPNNVEIQNFIGGEGGIILHNTFRPERIKQIAENNGLNADEILKRIRVVRCFNSDHQMLVTEKVEDLIKNDNLPVKLLIVDSLMSLFRSDFSGRGQLADRQQKLNKHMHTLLKLAINYSLAVYVTNQVMANPAVFFGDPTTPIGGHIVGHNCLTADSLVQLEDGTIIPMGDIEPGEKVIGNEVNSDLKISYASINKKIVNLNAKEIFEIDTGNKIRASAKHRFFKLNNFEIEEIYAENIKKGD